jgi:hypothetical protein
MREFPLCSNLKKLMTATTTSMSRNPIDQTPDNSNLDDRKTIASNHLTMFTIEIGLLIFPSFSTLIETNFRLNQTDHSKELLIVVAVSQSHWKIVTAV